jgi:hypothetical protein
MVIRHIGSSSCSSLIHINEIAAHKAWSDKWIGQGHHLLANLMDRLHKSPQNSFMSPYNHSLSIIQSSGMGKSRLMDSVAQMKFCFPFNIRGHTPPHQFGTGSCFGLCGYLTISVQHIRRQTSMCMTSSMNQLAAPRFTTTTLRAHTWHSLLRCSVASCRNSRKPSNKSQRTTCQFPNAGGSIWETVRHGML